MEPSIAALTASAGIAGVVLGTFLRPIVEGWFAVRQKTLHVIIQEPSEFRSPHESVVLSWHGEDLRRLIQTGFRLENRTGRTLRNFRVEIGAPRPTQDREIHSVYLENSARARYSVDEDGDKSVFKFELLEPKTSLSGSMLSNYTDQITVTSLDDVEIRRVRASSGGWTRFVAGMLSAAGLTAVASVAAALVGN